MVNRKPLLPAVFIAVLVGSIGFIQLASKPRFALFHNVDILQLLASGMCFGVALAALLFFLRGGSQNQG